MIPAHKEILIMLQEECSEVIHAVSKILRHGKHSTWPPDNPEDNFHRLKKELADLYTVIEFIRLLGLFSEEDEADMERLCKLSAQLKTRHAHHFSPKDFVRGSASRSHTG